MYLGYAIIQLPELLVIFYRKLTKNSNENEIKQNLVSPKDHKMTSKIHDLEMQSTRPRSNSQRPTELMWYRDNQTIVESSPSMVTFITKTDQEIQNKRIEKLEYEMSLILKNANK